MTTDRKSSGIPNSTGISERSDKPTDKFHGFELAARSPNSAVALLEDDNVDKFNFGGGPAIDVSDCFDGKLSLGFSLEDDMLDLLLIRDEFSLE